MAQTPHSLVFFLFTISLAQTLSAEFRVFKEAQTKEFYTGTSGITKAAQRACHVFGEFTAEVNCSRGKVSFLKAIKFRVRGWERSGGTAGAAPNQKAQAYTYFQTYVAVHSVSTNN